MIGALVLIAASCAAGEASVPPTSVDSEPPIGSIESTGTEAATTSGVTDTTVEPASGTEVETSTDVSSSPGMSDSGEADELDSGGVLTLSVAPARVNIGGMVHVSVMCMPWTADQFHGQVFGIGIGTTGQVIEVEQVVESYTQDSEGYVLYEVDYTITSEFVPGTIEVSAGCVGYGGLRQEIVVVDS